MALIFLAAAIVRTIPLLTAQLGGDEAVVGIMCLRVLAGDFPLFFFGQNFMGSLEAYLGAPALLLLGAHPWVLELLAVLLSLLFLFLTWRLGSRMFPESVVRTALIYLALPPVFLLYWAHEARLHYPLTLVFGTLLLLIVDRLIYRSPPRNERPWNLAALGLLAGLGWWTNHLVVVFLLPVLFFLWLHDKKIFLRPSFYLLVLSFLFGQLPQFLFQSRQPVPGLRLLDLIVWPDWQVIGADFFGVALPILAGIPYPFSGKPGQWIPYLVFLVSSGLSLLYVLFHRRAALAGLLRLNIKRANGLELLGLVLGATLAVNFLTVFNIRLNDNDQKYLLPVYTGLPFFLAFFICRLDRLFRGAGLLLLGLLLGGNLWGTLIRPGWPVLDRAMGQTIEQENRNASAVVQVLQEKGIRRIFAGDGLGERLTFFSAEQVIGADPYQAGSLRHARWVDGADRPAYLFSGFSAEWEQNLQALGGAWRKETLAGGFVLYTDFAPPDPLIPLPRSGWKVPAWSNDPQASKAFDGDMKSAWQAPQQVGTRFALDLGRKETIGKIAWWPGDYRGVPGGFQVEVSETGEKWQVVTRLENYRGPFFWSGPGPMIKVRRGRVETCFVPVAARFVRLTLMKALHSGDWSIHEILVYGPGGLGPVSGKGSGFLRDLNLFLREGKIGEVYADPWLSAYLHNEGAGKIRTLIYNHFLGDNGELVPAPELLYPLKINPDTALIVDRTEQGDCEAALRGAGLSFQKDDFGPYRVYSRLTQSPLLDHSGWKLAADINPGEIDRAVDGRIDTRWTSGRPQAPGMTVRVDLGRSACVEGVILKLGNSSKDYPRDLHLTVSADGRSWRQPETRWSSDLYWAGNRLFALQGDRAVYTFAPAACRYLKLEQRGSDPTYYWSIHELELIAGQRASR
jgi:hypothetical protein